MFFQTAEVRVGGKAERPLWLFEKKSHITSLWIILNWYHAKFCPINPNCIFISTRFHFTLIFHKYHFYLVASQIYTA